MRKINESLRKKLRKPLGKISKRLGKYSGKLISVGDIVSCQLIGQGIVPDLMIYDNRVKRRPATKEVARALDAVGKKVIRIRNKRGTIAEDAWIAISEGLKNKCKIIVSGEEDLLTLPAIMLAKNGTTIVYGQPNKGMVIVKVSQKKKNDVKKLIDEMEVVL